MRRLVADFTVIPSEVDERLEPGPFARSIAALAETKGRAVAATQPGGVVLAADTMVIIDDQALGKPVDDDDARAMLRRLRGRSHDVITGIVVIRAPRGPVSVATAVTQVLMAEYSDALMESYVASGAPRDKAGAYAIQDLGGALVAGLVGSYSNVVGLPLGATAGLLQAAGVPVIATAWS